MESAKEVAIAINKRYFTPATITSWVEEYIAKRDAEIRKECADKAVVLLKKYNLSLQSNWSPVGYSEIDLEWFERLRAAIEGTP